MMIKPYVIKKNGGFINQHIEKWWPSGQGLPGLGFWLCHYGLNQGIGLRSTDLVKLSEFLREHQRGGSYP